MPLFKKKEKEIEKQPEEEEEGLEDEGAEEAVPKPAVKKETKPQVEEVWEVGKLPTEYAPVIVKGDQVLDLNSAVALMLNRQEEILRIIGQA